MSRQNTFSELIKETNKVNVRYLSFSTLVAAGPRWCRHSYIVLLHQYINITYSVSIYIYNIYNIFNIFKVAVLCKRATILSHLSNSE